MAILQTVKMLYGGFAVQADFNSITCRPVRQMQENTRWENNSRRREPGLRDIEMSANGYFNMVADDSGIHDIITALRDTVTPATFAASGAVGTIAYSKPAVIATYQNMDGAVGDKHTITVSFDTAGETFRGTVLHPLGNITASAASASAELGAATANDVMWAALHVVTNPAETVDVDIESDTDEPFTAGGTVRASFTQIASGTGAEIIKVFDGRIDTPITDTFWRANITLQTAGPTSLLVVLGKLTIV